MSIASVINKCDHSFKFMCKCKMKNCICREPEERWFCEFCGKLPIFYESEYVISRLRTKPRKVNLGKNNLYISVIGIGGVKI